MHNDHQPAGFEQFHRIGTAHESFLASCVLERLGVYPWVEGIGSDTHVILTYDAMPETEEAADTEITELIKLQGEHNHGN